MVWLHLRRTCTGNGHRSFSASLRNSSGTEGEVPSATDPYPIASHPKRSRILSTAWSAAQRALPFLVPGRRASSGSPSGSSSSTLLEVRHRNRQERDGFLVRVIREECAHQLLGVLGKDHGRGDWCVERYRASD